MTAPVCLLEPDLKIEQPDPRTWPSIPIATDMASLLKANNAMRQTLMMLLNLLSRNNQQNGGGGGRTSSSKAAKQGKYSEVTRQVKTVRVTNPQDKSQYVDVEQIYALTMRDNNTGETWTWTR